MASDATKFRFVSPGIFLNEIDQSQIPAQPDLVGPVIIGRAEKGPGMIPTKVNTFSEFVEVFGYPISGYSSAGDVWRDGNYSAPSYGAYAAQAYLRAGVGPITFVRLLGAEDPERTSAGRAGWNTTRTPNVAIGSNGGAYGLFVFASGSGIGDTNSGTLAATWYLDTGAIRLNGTIAGASATTASAGSVIKTTNGEFKAEILDSSGNITKTATFNLTEGSQNFIRNQFNTNPQVTNSEVTVANNLQTYWLGETFEGQVSRLGLGDTFYGTILAVASGSGASGPFEQRVAYQDAHSGWFFGQNFDAAIADYSYESRDKLFKFVGINGYGEWLQNNVKISIDNVKAPSNDNVLYGSFDVIVRKANDTDLEPVILERFSSCNLNPESPNYIANMIGDIKMDYDATEKRYREYGSYPNRSRYVRVVLSDAVTEKSINKASLPFGVFGPPRYPSWTYASASTSVNDNVSSISYALGGDAIPFSSAPNGKVFIADPAMGTSSFFGTASIDYPAVLTRLSASDDSANPTTNAYFGAQTVKTRGGSVFDPGYIDYLRPLGEDVLISGDDYGEFGYPNNLTPQFVFSLDDVVLTTGASYSTSTPTSNISAAHYESGSLAAGISFTASSSFGAANYKSVLKAKVNRFTSPLFGGFDGLDITERDPFRNKPLNDGTPTETTSYVFHTLRRAVDTVADPEVVEMNILSIPGITHEPTTDYVIETCQARGDALGVIDVKGGFQPRHESNDSLATRQGNLGNVLTNMENRNLNNSYGATYYPWVKVRDSQTGGVVDCPPSVVALGVLANTERAADVWFAPAGFTRGGLSNGASGLTVTGLETRLTSRNRDDLYELNVNPIAQFPAEGIVVFGQKTLQATPSALDRINVRRLMIFVKRGISRIASTTLFQPNVQATWSDFKARADSFLVDVQARFGVDEFRVVLDETTTTADLIDRNILYAKVFIKPTRAIEFIAVDFIIARSGASFDD